MGNFKNGQNVRRKLKLQRDKMEILQTTEKEKARGDKKVKRVTENDGFTPEWCQKAETENSSYDPVRSFDTEHMCE